ncbi:MAG: hypothetical protein H6706_28735 [Myxococcales bacterium]|nr:hypothetical protein [Myxococcales bacterium]
MRPPLLLLALGLAGCGYGLVRPATTPVPAIGAVQDLSADGELGLIAAARLRRLAAGHPAGPGALTGRLAVAPDQALGRDGAGRGALFQADVTLDLEAGDGPAATWRARARATATWVRGSDPLATTAARQLALADATEAAVDAAWDRYLAGSPP